MQAKNLTTFTLVMLIAGAIDSIRNLPATALFGNTLIFFFIFSAIVFLLPTAFISAELSATYPEQGGVFNWVRMAFGDKVGFLAIWLQWINTMVWYPTILSFIAGVAAYLINPHLAENKTYLIAIILSVFWIMTLINLRGVQTSARFASVCAVIGMIIPMTLIISLAAIWIGLHKPLALQLSVHKLLPNFSSFDSWISLTAIMTSFLGMELATVHVRHVANPRKTFPKALLFSVLIILATMIFGAFAIAIVLPAKQISLIDGIMQAFNNFLSAYHLHWAMPILAIMILIGSIGGMINWIISPARGLLQAARLGFLPPFLQRENKYGVAQNLLILQAILVSLVCLAFLLMPSVNGSYWLLTDLSTQIYMLMYVLMFMAYLKIRHDAPAQTRPYQIPGGNQGAWTVGLLGLLGTLITLAVGFFPPSNINVGSFWHYEILFSSGIVIMILPVTLFYLYERTELS